MLGGDDLEKTDDDKDLELDLMAEQELLRLTRQFRVMEGDKEAYLDEATKALRRQRKIIDDLNKEKSDLERELRSARSRQNSRRDGENAAKLARLAEEQENLLSDIKSERVAHGDLESEVTRIERMVAHQRRAAAAKANPIAAMQQQQKEQQQQQQQQQQVKGATAGGKQQPQQQQQSASAATTKMLSNLREKRDVGQKIVLLENRLDGVMTNFNATLSQNSIVRKEIDHLVQERSTFNDMIAKLQKKIGANKKTIADITELAIQAFDQRDECQSKIQALQERNEKDASQYASELKELQRTLDHDERLKDFLFNKSNDRVFTAAAGSGGVNLDDDQQEKGKKAAEEKEQEEAKKYKQAFEKIMKIVGVTDTSNLDKIVADFIRVEDQNFALFNYVTEMNNQVEGLQEGIAKLKTDIKEAKGRGEEKERQQREQLANMERRLDASQHEAEAAETKLELMETVIDKLKAGTELLYYNAKVGSTPVLSLLSAAGAAAGGTQQAKEQTETAEEDGALPRKQFVTENNVIMYLDMVHEKVVELQAVSQYLTYREQLEAAEAAAVAAGGAGGGATAQLQAVMLLQQQQAAAQAQVHAGGGVKLSISGAAGPVTSGAVSVEKQLKRMPSSAQMLGKHDEELGLEGGEHERREGDEEDGEIKPFDLTALKTRAFVVTQRERREAALAAVKAAGEGGAGAGGDGAGGEGIDGIKKDHHGGKRSRAGVRKNKH